MLSKIISETYLHEKQTLLQTQSLILPVKNLIHNVSGM